jgi:hypothetical protein
MAALPSDWLGALRERAEIEAEAEALAAAAG